MTGEPLPPPELVERFTLSDAAIAQLTAGALRTVQTVLFAVFPRHTSCDKVELRIYTFPRFELDCRWGDAASAIETSIGSWINVPPAPLPTTTTQPERQAP